MAATENVIEKLHIRLIDGEPSPTRRQVLVVDDSGNVLGDLAHSVGSIRVRMDAGSFTVLELEVMAESAVVDSIDCGAGWRGRLDDARPGTRENPIVVRTR